MPTEGKDRINVRFADYMVNRAHNPEGWKDLFDYPHLFGDGAVDSWNGLPCEATKVTGNEKQSVKGLIFEHKLIAKQIV